MAEQDRDMVETVQQFQTGQQTAFESLIRTHQGSVYAIILGYVRSREDAMDLTQEVFLRAYRFAKSLKDPKKFAGWLGSIARHTALNFIKRNQVERSLLEDLAWSNRHEEKFSDSETEAALEAVEKLDEIYRTPFMLKYMEDRSVDEIAALLEIPTSTAKGRLYQARLQLRKELTDRRDA